ncbi:MAG: hypothetical protein ACXW1W_16000 [Methylococcaceae bacterium]
MTRKLCPFPEEDLHEAARSILVNEAKLLQQSATVQEAGIWSAGVNKKADHTAYWIGEEKIVCAFLIVRPFCLPSLNGQEAVRGWAHIKLRGTGCFAELMQVASREFPLVADREGMTEMAHTSWLKARGFSQSYYDQTNMEQVAVAQVPENEKFTKLPAGARWLLVLTPTLPELLGEGDA